MNRLALALERTRAELDRLELRWAVIGGLALAVRAEPRQTRDIDIAIAVEGDREAEAAVHSLTERGFQFVVEGSSSRPRSIDSSPCACTNRP